MADFLVTGAAGFIGAAVAESLINEGHTVYTIDNLSTGSESHLPKGIIFFKGGCQDPLTIQKLADKKIEAIYHIAGQSSGEISFDDPVYDLQTNTQSTLLLLELAIKINCKKFIYASSMSVYGDMNVAANEDDVLRPKSFYAVGKLASEHYLRIYEQFGIIGTTLRLCNTYGIGQNMNNMRQGMVSIYLSMALKTKQIHVKGSKDRFRDFLYIEDVVSAFLAAGSRSDGGYRYFNVTANAKVTVEMLIEVMRETLEDEIEVHYEGFTPGDQFGIFGNNSKIKEELGWYPKISFENGLRKMSRWAKVKYEKSL